MPKTILLTALIALSVGGVVLARGSTPPDYEVPAGLKFSNPYFRCPTALTQNVANYVSWAIPEDRVVVGLQEKNPTTGQWVSTQYVFSTSYRVLDVAFRLGGQELFIAGVQIDGEDYIDVIEKWVFPPTPGAYAVSLNGGTTPLGVPRGSLSAGISILGGTYQDASNRISTPQPVPTKTMLYSARNGGHLNCIVADPEGRFLLVHNYTTGDVSSMDLSNPRAGLQVAFSSGQNSALASAQTMVLHDVPEVGRICRLTAENRYGAYPSGSNLTTVLVDADNDGIFNSFTVHSSVEITQGLTPYGDSANWHSVVNFGWDWQSETD